MRNTNKVCLFMVMVPIPWSRDFKTYYFELLLQDAALVDPVGDIFSQCEGSVPIHHRAEYMSPLKWLDYCWRLFSAQVDIRSAVGW